MLTIIFKLLDKKLYKSFFLSCILVISSNVLASGSFDPGEMVCGLWLFGAQEYKNAVLNGLKTTPDALNKTCSQVSFSEEDKKNYSEFSKLAAQREYLSPKNIELLLPKMMNQEGKSEKL